MVLSFHGRPSGFFLYIVGIGGFVMKEENVIKYYVLCTKLKDLIRKGWQDWNIQRDRVESVAEHIYGTQMLAIAMYSAIELDVCVI